MCGITGYFSTDPTLRRSKDQLAQMARALHHRGPDGQGFFRSPEEGLFMAHTRLAIVDLLHGEQPLHCPMTGNILTANGEFYEFQKLRTRLALAGHRFESRSDSEVALQLYARHGPDFVQYLRGEFALALYDRKEKRLILLRDRYGIRPLFYKLQNNTLFYGSEIKSIFAHSSVERRISPFDALHQLIQIQLPGHTLFEGVHALLPGHMLIVRENNGRLELEYKEYYDLNFPCDGEHPVQEAGQAIRDVSDLLLDSVAERLQADVPVACYLSGGIDSCSILGLASLLGQSALRAFTIRFEDARYDESALSRQMAVRAGADQEILTVDGQSSYGSEYLKAVWHSERTFYNTLGVAKMLLSRRVTSRGFKVVLTGEGSDEIFGGYTAFKIDMFRYDPAYTAADQERLLGNNALFAGSILPDGDIEHPAFQDLMGWTPAWIKPWMETYRDLKGLLAPGFQELLSGYDPFAALAGSLRPDRLKGRHALDKAQYTWIKTMLEGQILNWGGDRMDMAHSLESRPAFLDHPLVEYASSVAPGLRIRKGTEKWVLREAMHHLLPEALYNREKFSFMAPPAHTVEGRAACLADLCQEHLSKERLERLGIVPASELQALLDKSGQSHAERTRKDILLNQILGLHILEEQFIQNSPAGMQEARLAMEKGEL